MGRHGGPDGAAIAAEAPDGVHVSLLEWPAVHSTLMRSSVDAMARKAGWDPRRGSFAHWATTATATATASPSPTAVHIPPLVDNEAVRSVSAVAHLDSDPDRRVELEAKFERAFLDKPGRPRRGGKRCQCGGGGGKAARGSDVDLH